MEIDENNNPTIDDKDDDSMAASFCRDNLFLVLQRRSRWLFPRSSIPVEQRLFEAYLQVRGIKSKENFFKRLSKKKQEQRLKAFDFSIAHWLRTRYPSYVPFVFSSTINYDGLQLTRAQAARQRLLGTPNGYETEVKFSPFDHCHLNRLALLECGDKCDGTCGNKESSSDYRFEDFMELRYVDKDVGAGLYAIVDLPQGAYLGLVTGEALSATQNELREGGPNQSYIFSTKPDSKTVVVALDPKQYGNHTRFFNHSCEPNCQFETWLAEQKWVNKFYTSRVVHKVSGP